MALIDDLNQRKLKRQQEANAAYGKAISTAGPSISSLPGGAYAKDYVDQIGRGNKEGGVPGAIAAGVRNLPGGMIATGADVLNMAKPLVAPLAQIGRGIATGDYSVDGKATPAPAIAAPSAKPAPKLAPPVLDNIVPQADPAAAGGANPAPTNAENVALNDPQQNQPTIAGGVIRRIGNSYTNDPAQTGGVALGVNQKPGVVTGEVGGLSTYSNPETAGMSAAQASQYWKGISAEIDARNAVKDQQANLDNSQASYGDSIGTLLAKKANRASAQKGLDSASNVQLGVNRAQADLVASTDPASVQRRALENEALGLGVRGKKQELGAQDQLAALQAKYLEKPTPELAQTIAVLQGRAADKYQVVTEKGVGVDGTTPTQTAYLVDAAGNVRPVSQGQTQAQSLPAGLVVGAPSKQADGKYNANGKMVTIKNGKVIEIT